MAPSMLCEDDDDDDDDEGGGEGFRGHLNYLLFPVCVFHCIVIAVRQATAGGP